MEMFAGSETAGAKIRSREGKSPDRQLRSLIRAKWERMWCCPDSQDVGLEAAIIKRKRNSSLVKRHRAENVTGLKHVTEATDSAARLSGRGAFCGPVKVLG
jgi:hypothetical protein